MICFYSNLIELSKGSEDNMDFDTIIVRFGEMSTKGKNKKHAEMEAAKNALQIL